MCAVCQLETFSKGGFVWHQTAAHGRPYGNGVPGNKSSRSTTLEEDEATATLDGVPPRPPARRRPRRSNEARPLAENGVETDAGDAPVYGRATAALGALVADDSGSYDAAIRAQLYPLLEMTGELREHIEEGGDARGRDADAGSMDDNVPYESLSTRVFRLNEVLDDAARAVPVLERRKNSMPGRFSTRRLRALQQFVLGVGGAGLSVREQRQLYNFLEVWDSHDSLDPMAPRDNLSLQAVFPTISSFTNALRDDLDDAVLGAGWKKLSIREGGTVYEVYFRSVLEVVIDRLREGGAAIRLWSGDGAPAPLTNSRETPMDGDAFRLCERDVVDTHGSTSFVLGLHLYSDSTRLSWSSGKSFFCVCTSACFLCGRMGTSTLCIGISSAVCS